MRTEKSWAWIPVPLLKVTLDSIPHGGTSLYFAFLGHKIKVERKEMTCKIVSSFGCSGFIAQTNFGMTIIQATHTITSLLQAI